MSPAAVRMRPNMNSNSFRVRIVPPYVRLIVLRLGKTVFSDTQCRQDYGKYVERRKAKRNPPARHKNFRSNQCRPLFPILVGVGVGLGEGAGVGVGLGDE